MSAVDLTRRAFLKVSVAAGGGMLIGFHIPEALPASIQPKPWTALPQGAEINAWLAIDAEGNVTVRVPHTEMGQGALTSVAMMIAEEFERGLVEGPGRIRRYRIGTCATTRITKVMSTHGSDARAAAAPAHHAGRRIGA